MCCGRSRHIAASPRHESLKRDGEIFTYLGRTALTVTGPATGLVYRFAAPGTRVRVDGGRNPLAAHTTWEVIGRRLGTSLLRVHLRRGRAHQVRAHLAAAGYPIVGDSIYGGATAAGLHLHAAAVRFRHPQSGALILIESPPPAWAKIDRWTDG